MDIPKKVKYYHFFIPIMEVLNELGGSANKEEITDMVIERVHISEEEQEKTTKGGTSYFKTVIGWARNYLVLAGLIERSEKGLYSLTEKGLKAELTEEETINLYNEVLDLIKQ